ncbi:MAG: shikimate kinase [Lentisphaeria bacterium]|nr:shikimate kinase [Lentisphaeria bacterium]
MIANNVSLIGMPGAGKSTIGVLLAKEFAFNFLDTDLLIQSQHHSPLSDIIAEIGNDGFRDLENKMLANLTVEDQVIATGGSACYCPEGMQNLAKLGPIVLLDIELKELQERLGCLKERGVVIAPGQTLQDLKHERDILYKKYASITIDCSHKTMEEIVAEIKDAI